MSELVQDATPLISNYTIEDFTTEKPYKELYDQRGNPFLQQIMIQKMRDLALSLGFKSFMTMWKSYLAAQRKDISIDEIGNDTMFENQPRTLRCGAYTCTDRVTRINELGMEVEVISHPIMPVKRVTNIETFESKLEIAFQRGNEPWKSMTVSREQLASAQKIVGLARQDVAVNSENAKEVVKFLGLLESKNYNDLPRQNSVSHMGWLSDGRFMPYVDDITYDGESAELDKVYRELKPTGDETKWMEIARKVRNGDSVPARIALAAGFAAPLVKLLDALPFFVHLWGEKGCGKTVGLMLSASIWGNPELGGLAKTFSGTRVSFELHAAFCCNLPVMLDELQVINDNRRNFDDIIYMLCEGVSKGRGAKEGGLQLQKRWSTCIITTGETPIIQSNSGGGAAVRTIEVNYKDNPLFGDDETARETAAILKENYGFVGKKFIEAISAPGMIDALKTIQKKYYKELADGIDGKQVLSASILLAADALAATAIFKDKRNLTSEELKEFLITKEESDVNRRCYEFLLGWIDRNPRRFDSVDSNNGECWGIIEHDVAYINKTVFEDALRNNGYAVKPFMNWAKVNNKLEYEDHGEGDERRLTVRKTLPSGRSRCIALRLVDLDPPTKPSEQAEYRKYVAVEDPDMPF